MVSTKEMINHYIYYKKWNKKSKKRKNLVEKYLQEPLDNLKVATFFKKNWKHHLMDPEESKLHKYITLKQKYSLLKMPRKDLDDNESGCLLDADE